MKNKNEYPKIILTNPEFVAKMTTEVKAAKVEFQKLLDLWNDANLKPFKTYGELFQFFYSPSAVPDNVIIQAKVCRNTAHNAPLELWDIIDNTIEVNEAEFYRLAHIFDVVVNNEVQEQFAKDAIEFGRLSNHLADTIMQLPTGRQMGEPYKIVGNPFAVLKKVELQVDYLQELVKVVV